MAEAPGEIALLASRGARLERAALHLEGGHSRRRIVNAGGDAIGREVHRVLRAALESSRVQVLTRCVALDALAGDQGQVGGVLAGMAGDDGVLQVGAVTARAVVLATGGFGQAYATTTNPAGLTGDGLALAARAGAELRDVEFVQFHPTVLWQDSARGQCPLITEALRGAGAVLVDAAGRPVMPARHPLGDLAPRDVVAAAMQQRMEEGDGPGDHLWLDATGLGRAVLERDFPTVAGLCRARGIDPAAEPIPVAPGAHYACGGIRASMDGRTSVPGLYAVGEAASTGVHGANRLASNSLTEALITGRRTGNLLGQDLCRPPARLRLPPPGPGVNPALRPALAAAMSRHAGVSRDRAGLERLQQALDRALPARGRLSIAIAEAANLHAVSVLVAAAALARTESRGCHRWRDAPLAAPGGRARHTVVRPEAGRRGGRLCPGGSGGRRMTAEPPLARRLIAAGPDPSVTRRLIAAGLDPEDTWRLVRGALGEDLRYGPDITSAATAAPGTRAAAAVVAREPGVLAGLPVALAVLDAGGIPAEAAEPRCADGDRITRGSAVLRIRGPLRELLGAERTMLNFLTHLSGIATATRAWADALAGTGCAVRDTRKTTPGLRQLEKYAVRCGGGVNHRMGLGDAALIKDNHVAAAGGVAAAIAAVRAAAPGLPLEVECDTLAQVRQALDAGATLILLDNMGLAELRAAAGVAARYPAARLEASGGLRLEEARAVAATGVDFVAVGALTHSSPALDLGLDLLSGPVS